MQNFFITIAVLGTTLFYSCSEGFMTQEASQVDGKQLKTLPTEDLGVKASIRADSNEVQIVDTEDEGLSNVQVTIPVDSLSKNTSLAIDPSVDLSTQAVMESLKLDEDNEVTKASESISITADADEKGLITSALQISLEIQQQQSLKLADDDYQNLIVLYKRADLENEGSYIVGILSREKITVQKGKASFGITFLGSFQLAYTAKVIEKEVTAKTSIPPLKKTEESQLSGSIQSLSVSAAANRNLRVAIQFQDFDPVDCVYILDRDKASPWDYKAKELPEAAPPVTTAAHTQYLYVECLNDKGKSLKSPWLQSIKVPALEFSLGQPAVTNNIASLSLNIGSSVKFQYAVADPVTACDSLDSSPESVLFPWTEVEGNSIRYESRTQGKFKFCLRAAGNHLGALASHWQAPFTVNSTYDINISSDVGAITKSALWQVNVSSDTYAPNRLVVSQIANGDANAATGLMKCNQDSIISVNSGSAVIRLPAGDGIKTYCLQGISSGGVLSNPTTVQVQLDTSAPNLTNLKIAEGDAYVSASNITLEIAAEESFTSYRYAVNQDCGNAEWRAAAITADTAAQNFVESLDLSLASGEGSYTLCAQVRDLAGNASSIKTKTITYDSTAPAISHEVPTIIGPDYTSGDQTTLTANISESVSGIAEAKWQLQDGISGSKCLNADKTAFNAACPVWHNSQVTAAAWSASIADNLFFNGSNYELTLSVTDSAGNSVSDNNLTFTWESSSLNLSTEFTINSAAANANDPVLSLDLIDQTNVNQYRIAEGINCTSVITAETYQGYISGSPISYELIDASDGLKTICLQGKATDGSESTIATANINFDGTEPVTAITSSGTIGPSTTAGSTTDIMGNASDAVTSIAEVKVSIQNMTTTQCLNIGGTAFDAVCPVWIPATGTTSWAISLNDFLFTDGTYELSARASDLVGNVQTSPATSTLIWDSGPPSPAFSINAGEAITASQNISLTLTDDTDVYEYRVSNTNDCSAATWTSYAGTAIAHTLPATDNNYSICLEVRDQAQNAASASSSIILDITPPAAILSGAPPQDSFTANSTLAVTISASETLAAYKYKIGLSVSTDCALSTGYSAEATPGSTIGEDISVLGNGEILLCVLAQDEAGNWQEYASATTHSWFYDDTPPSTTLDNLSDLDTIGPEFTPGDYTDIFATTEDLNLDRIEWNLRSVTSNFCYDPGTQNFDMSCPYTNSDIYNEAGPVGWVVSIFDAAMQPGDYELSFQAFDSTGTPEAYQTITFTWQGGIGPAKTEFTQVSAGGNFSCGLTADGQLYCWGYNFFGQLGNGSTATSEVPLAINTGSMGSITEFIAVDSGADHTCAIAADRQVYCWGNASSGQLGNGTTTQQTSPSLISGSQRFLKISAGDSFTCGITSLHEIYCWGFNGTGQLGIGTTTNQLNPVLIDTSGLAVAHFIDISAGKNHACAVTADFQGVCWGRGDFGQLGDNNLTDSLTPVLVDMTNSATGITTFKQISAGTAHSCGVATDGRAYCWGDKLGGRLGDTMTTGTAAIPTPVDISLFTAQASSPYFREIHAGPTYSCGITSDNQAVCFGSDVNQVLGNGAVGNSPSPIYVDTTALPPEISHRATSIALGELHACMTMVSGEISCWGSDNNEQLANGAGNLQQPSPDLIQAGSLPVNSSMTKLALGADHTCGLTGSGRVFCWGYNTGGALGDNSFSDKHTPALVDTSAFNGEEDWFIDVVAGSSASCALTSEARVYCWGEDYIGTLGNGVDNTAKGAPVLIDHGAFDLDDPPIKLDLYADHACAITGAGKAFCWGDNNYSQVNSASGTSAQSPVSINTSNLSLYEHPVNIFVSIFHTCFTSNLGKNYCWGGNMSGQLGSGNTTSISNATEISQTNSPPLFTGLSLGDESTCSLAIGGDLICWGDNAAGQLATGDFVNLLNPQLSSPGMSFVAMDSSFRYRCGIRDDGLPYCWGEDSGDQLGNGAATTNQPNPQAVSIGGGLAFKDISLSAYRACALAANGDVYCWGQDYYGSFGDGATNSYYNSPTLINQINTSLNPP